MGGSREGRTPRHGRARARPSVRTRTLLSLARTLTARDRELLEELYEYRMLTVHQIQHMHFNSAPVTRRRMVRLYRLGVVDRFQPAALGSAPSHYVLDFLGARIVAAQRGIEYRQLGFRKEDVDQLPWRSDLAHIVGVNEFFARLIGACLCTLGTHQLADRMSESRCRHRWGGIVLPDGYGVLRAGDAARSFWLEYDRGTESPGRVAAKLPAYHSAATLADASDVLLFCFPDPGREVAARTRLHAPGITLATTSWDRFEPDPLGEVWLSIDSQRRARLLDLPGHSTRAHKK